MTASPIPKSSVGDIIHPAWTDRSSPASRAIAWVICTYTVWPFRKSNQQMTVTVPTLSKWKDLLPTEATNPESHNPDEAFTTAIIELMLDEDRRVVAAVRKEKARIATAADLFADALRKGVHAAFFLPKDGGKDSYEKGAQAIARFRPTRKDLLVGRGCGSVHVASCDTSCGGTDPGRRRPYDRARDPGHRSGGRHHARLHAPGGGGMRAVIWTDVVQLVVYMSGALIGRAILWQDSPGGWNEVMSRAHAARKLRVRDLSLDSTRSYTVWSGVIGGMFLTAATLGIVLGTFWLATTSIRGTRSTLIGIVAGGITLATLRLGTEVSWQWYVLVDSATTWAVGWTAARDKSRGPGDGPRRQGFVGTSSSGTA